MSAPSEAGPAAAGGPANAAYYDGVAARRRAVAVALTPTGIDIAENGAVLARWRFLDLRRLDGPTGMRLRSLGAPDLSRLEIADPALADAIARRSPSLDEAKHLDRRSGRRIVGWSLAAALSLVLTVIYGVPVAADRLAPLVPLSWERRLGDAVDNQVRTLFGRGTCADPDGRAALARLFGQLRDRAQGAGFAEITVLDSPIPNAIALPGGRIYLFAGLLRQAENPDEVAGVLAHELGHVAARDGLRSLIRSGGSSFLLGLLFGDVTGSGTLILLGQTLLDTAHGRDAERAADRRAADLMTALGRSPTPMGAFLLRLTGTERGAPLPFLRSHPVTEDRIAALRARDAPVTGAPLLSDEEWRAVKRICRPS